MAVTTYEMMKSYWPTPDAIKNDPVMALALNNSPKIVFQKHCRMWKKASIQAIRKIDHEATVIVVSGLIEKDKLAKIENNHTYPLLPKPYTAERLLKTIREILSVK